jgi:hypothetical protein
MTEKKTKRSANAAGNAGKKPPSTAWAPGQSGNPAGKKPGTRNRATAIAEAVLEKDVEAIAKVVTKAAKGGDLQAARLVLERLVPPRRERPLSIDLPDVTTTADVAKAQAAILAHVGAGDILPSEATALSAIVEQRRKALESEELERRIAALEGKKK